MRAAIVLLFLLLSACTEPPPAICIPDDNQCPSGCLQATDPDCEDADQDTFYIFEDCDDSNAQVNPSAQEVCDGIDNNCDNAIDEGCNTPPPPIGDTYDATVTIDTNNIIKQANSKVFGANSWIENQKFGWPTHPTQDQYNNHIQEFYDFIEDITQTHTKFLRIPGGLQANHDHWEDMVGSFEQRPERTASGVKQISIAGIDEHLEAAEKLGAQIIYTINWGDGAQSAAQLVEYLKGQVYYYEIGNELNCAGSGLVETYANQAKEIIQAMKAVDSTIKVGVLDDCNKNREEWYDTLYPIIKDDADFWIKHAYSPGSDGAVFGFTINDEEYEVSAPFTIEESGSYTLEILAEGKKNPQHTPGFTISIDGKNIETKTLHTFSGLFKTDPKPAYYQVRAELTKGDHELTLKTTSTDNNAWIRFHPIVSAIKDKEVLIDLRNDPKVAGLVTAGALEVERQMQQEESWYRDLPIIMTEWNTVYNFIECNQPIFSGKQNRCQKPTQMLESLNIAEYYHVFLRNPLIEGANFWLLMTDLGYIDIRNGYKIHPSYYVAGMYGEAFANADTIQVEVSSPSYDVGYSQGITLGKVDQDLTVDYLSATAAITDNEIIIALINKHTQKGAHISLNVANKGSAKIITAPHLLSDQVSISTQEVTNGDILIPKHSIAVLTFPK